MGSSKGVYKNPNNSEPVYGIIRGIVVDNQDPETLGRLKIEVPGITPVGMAANGLPWASPCFPCGGGGDYDKVTQGYGDYYVPQIGASVWVQFELGDTDKPVWIGTWPGKPYGISDNPQEVIEENDRSFVRIIKSPIGHRIYMNDNPDKSGITVRSARGARLELIDVVNDEVVALSDKDDNRIEIATNDREIRIVSASGFFWKMNLDTGEITTTTAQSREATGDKIVDTSGQSLNSVGGGRTEATGGDSVESVGGDKTTTILGLESKKIANKNIKKKAIEWTIVVGDWITKILKGTFNFSTLLGDFKFSTKAGSIDLENLIAKLQISKTGSVELGNKIGTLSLSPTGGIDIKNKIGKFSIDVAGNVTIEGLNITVSPKAICKLGNGLIPINNLPACLFVGSPHNIGNPKVLA